MQRFMKQVIGPIFKNISIITGAGLEGTLAVSWVSSVIQQPLFHTGVCEASWMHPGVLQEPADTKAAIRSLRH